MRGIQLLFLEIEWNTYQDTWNKKSLNLYSPPSTFSYPVFHESNHRLFLKSDLQIIVDGASFVYEHLSLKRSCDFEDPEWKIYVVSLHSI